MEIKDNNSIEVLKQASQRWAKLFSIINIHIKPKLDWYVMNQPETIELKEEFYNSYIHVKPGELEKVFVACIDSIDSENIIEFRLNWNKFKRFTNFPIIADNDVIENIEMLIVDIAKYSPDKIYLYVKKTEINVPKIISTIDQLIFTRIYNNPKILYSMRAREFEEFIVDIFSQLGYCVELTAKTHDGGRDVIAISNNNSILNKLLIECKHYREDRKIGISHVRELYAVKSLEKATKAILATTSSFTKGARELEKQLIYELELKDFNDIILWSKMCMEMQLKNKFII